MAMNPMQRKIRNSFLFGFLVAVIVAAVVIGFLFMRIKAMREEAERKAAETKVATKTVYVLSEDVRAGGNIKAEPADVLSKYVPENAITEIGEDFTDDEGELKLIATVDMKANTILTSDLVTAQGDVGSYRTVEFNSIILPSKLMAGDYIDIRLQIVDSVDSLDYIVLSKIYVEDCTATTLWLNLTDAELQLLDCALVESYAIEGSRIYATQFRTELEPKIEETYVPTAAVTAFIKANAATEIDKAIAERYEEDDSAARTQRDSGYDARSVRETLNSIHSIQGDSLLDNTRSGLEAEKTSIKAAREALMGEDY